MESFKVWMEAKGDKGPQPPKSAGWATQVKWHAENFSRYLKSEFPEDHPFRKRYASWVAAGKPGKLMDWSGK